MTQLTKRLKSTQKALIVSSISHLTDIWNLEMLLDDDNLMSEDDKRLLERALKCLELMDLGQ